MKVVTGKFLFDSNVVEYTFDKDGNVKNLNEKVPDWFVKWLVQKEKLVLSMYYIKQNILFCDYPPNVIKKDPDNPGTIYKPAARAFSTREPYNFSLKDGGDGRTHEIVYYERVINDERAKDNYDGKRYVTEKGYMRLNFQGNLYVPRENLALAIFLVYFSTKKGIDYVIIDKVSQAERKTNLRKMFTNAQNMIMNENYMPEEKLRAIAAGEYKIANAMSEEIKLVRNMLSEHIENIYFAGGANAVAELERFTGYVSEFSEDIEAKAIVMQAIDEKAVIIKRTGIIRFAYTNAGAVDNISYGKKLFQMSEDDDLFQRLYNHLFELGNKDSLILIKKFLQKDIKKDARDVALERLRKLYLKIFNEEAPYDMVIEELENAIMGAVNEEPKKNEFVPDSEYTKSEIDEMDLYELQDVYPKIVGKQVPKAEKYKNNDEWLRNKIKEAIDLK